MGDWESWWLTTDISHGHQHDAKQPCFSLCFLPILPPAKVVSSGEVAGCMQEALFSTEVAGPGFLTYLVPSISNAQ